MDDSHEEQHEIRSASFEPCGAYVGPGASCTSTRRFALRRQHIGLYCEAGHRKDWLPHLPWAKPEDFRGRGPFAGWVPADAFSSRGGPPKSVRRGGWELSERARHEFEVRLRAADATCIACDTPWFQGERNTREALIWLRNAEPRGLYAEVRDAINKMMPKPRAADAGWYAGWYDVLPLDLRLEVGYRFDDSHLRADHPLAIEFLRAAKKVEAPGFDLAVQRFAVDGLAMPVCEKCSRAKGARLFDTREELLRKWAAYRFGGNVLAARLHPDFKRFEYLAHLAYDTGLAEQVEAALRQRRRSA